MILGSPAGERQVEARDFAFVYFERIFYGRRSPRSEDPLGRRVEVEDRRGECACLYLSDWTRIKFGKLRQIEIRYPPEERGAVVAVTWRNGRLKEFRGESLYGGDSPMPPRFAVTIEGGVREFPLILDDTPGAAWPAEPLLRVLFLPQPPPPRPARPRR